MLPVDYSFLGKYPFKLCGVEVQQNTTSKLVSECIYSIFYFLWQQMTIAKEKQNMPRKIPAITSDVKCTERYILLIATDTKIMVAIIKKSILENLLFIVDASNKKEDIKKTEEMVACPLGKLKPVSCSKKLSGRTLSTRFLINSGSIVPRDVAIVKM